MVPCFKVDKAPTTTAGRSRPLPPPPIPYPLPPPHVPVRHASRVDSLHRTVDCVRRLPGGDCIYTYNYSMSPTDSTCPPSPILTSSPFPSFRASSVKRSSSRTWRGRKVSPNLTGNEPSTTKSMGKYYIVYSSVADLGEWEWNLCLISCRSMCMTDLCYVRVVRRSLCNTHDQCSLFGADRQVNDAHIYNKYWTNNVPALWC